MKKKTMAMLIALVLVLVCAVGGTLAWLTDKTQVVTNTFTVGNIDISLTETGAEDTDDDGYVDSNDNFKLIPGTVYSKDPAVTVEGGSEACWLFVKVAKSSNYDSFVTSSVAEGWTPVDGHKGYYYRAVAADDQNQTFYVLAGNDDNPNGIVTINEGVTKDMIDEIEANPQITFIAAAIQQENVSVIDAWSKLPVEFTEE